MAGGIHFRLWAIQNVASAQCPWLPPRGEIWPWQLSAIKASASPFSFLPASEEAERTVEPKCRHSWASSYSLWNEGNWSPRAHFHVARQIRIERCFKPKACKGVCIPALSPSSFWTMEVFHLQPLQLSSTWTAASTLRNQFLKFVYSN
jgi:hypothetical protein